MPAWDALPGLSSHPVSLRRYRSRSKRYLPGGVDADDVDVALVVLLSRIPVMPGNVFGTIKITLAFGKRYSCVVPFSSHALAVPLFAVRLRRRVAPFAG